MRPNSADGRLFIWLNTCHMIADHPLWGTGTCGWLANYMHYQANYFSLHPDSCFTRLADNAFYTYNEVLHWVAEQGIMGGLMLVFCLNTLFRSDNDRKAKALLLTYGVFACFSYPMDVFELQILLAVLLGMQQTSTIYKIPIPPKACLCIALPCVIGFGAYIFNLRQADEPSFYRYDARHIYYSIQRFITDKHSVEEKLSALHHALQIVPTSELYTNMGDLWLQKGDTLRTEAHYQTAAHMTPSRMTPHYKLFKLSTLRRDPKSATTRGRKLLTLSIKRESTVTLRMKAEAMEYLDTTKAMP